MRIRIEIQTAETSDREIEQKVRLIISHNMYM